MYIGAKAAEGTGYLKSHEADIQDIRFALFAILILNVLDLQ